MKVSFLTALGVLGALAFLYGRQGPGIDTISVGATGGGPGGIYELSQGEERCLLHRTPLAKNAGELVGYGCEAMLPAFSEGLYWTERPDGVVAFVTRERRSILEFGPADGIDYESFSPREPIYSLAERR